MQIQRIQTIYLLLASVLTGIFLFIPFGSLTLSDAPDANVSKIFMDLKPINFWSLMIPSATGALLLFIDIFLYNNFKLQKTVLSIAILLIVVSTALVVYINISHAGDGELQWSGGICLLIASLIGAIAAMSRIRHDEQLIKASNRLL